MEQNISKGNKVSDTKIFCCGEIFCSQVQLFHEVLTKTKRNQIIWNGNKTYDNDASQNLFPFIFIFENEQILCTFLSENSKKESNISLDIKFVHTLVILHNIGNNILFNFFLKKV